MSDDPLERLFTQYTIYGGIEDDLFNDVIRAYGKNTTTALDDWLRRKKTWLKSNQGNAEAEDVGGVVPGFLAEMLELGYGNNEGLADSTQDEEKDDVRASANAENTQVEDDDGASENDPELENLYTELLTLNGEYPVVSDMGTVPDKQYNKEIRAQLDQDRKIKAKSAAMLNKGLGPLVKFLKYKYKKTDKESAKTIIEDIVNEENEIGYLFNDLDLSKVFDDKRFKMARKKYKDQEHPFDDWVWLKSVLPDTDQGALSNFHAQVKSKLSLRKSRGSGEKKSRDSGKKKKRKSGKNKAAATQAETDETEVRVDAAENLPKNNESAADVLTELIQQIDLMTNQQPIEDVTSFVDEAYKNPTILALLNRAFGVKHNPIRIKNALKRLEKPLQKELDLAIKELIKTHSTAVKSGRRNSNSDIMQDVLTPDTEDQDNFRFRRAALEKLIQLNGPKSIDMLWRAYNASSDKKSQELLLTLPLLDTLALQLNGAQNPFVDILDMFDTFKATGQIDPTQYKKNVKRHTKTIMRSAVLYYLEALLADKSSTTKTKRKFEQFRDALDDLEGSLAVSNKLSSAEQLRLEKKVRSALNYIRETRGIPDSIMVLLKFYDSLRDDDKSDYTNVINEFISEIGDEFGELQGLYKGFMEMDIINRAEFGQALDRHGRQLQGIVNLLKIQSEYDPVSKKMLQFYNELERMIGEYSDFEDRSTRDQTIIDEFRSKLKGPELDGPLTERVKNLLDATYESGGRDIKTIVKNANQNADVINILNTFDRAQIAADALEILNTTDILNEYSTILVGAVEKMLTKRHKALELAESRVVNLLDEAYKSDGSDLNTIIRNAYQLKGVTDILRAFKTPVQITDALRILKDKEGDYPELVVKAVENILTKLTKRNRSKKSKPSAHKPEEFEDTSDVKNTNLYRVIKTANKTDGARLISAAVNKLIEEKDTNVAETVVNEIRDLSDMQAEEFKLKTDAALHFVNTYTLKNLLRDVSQNKKGVKDALDSLIARDYDLDAIWSLIQSVQNNLPKKQKIPHNIILAQSIIRNLDTPRLGEIETYIAEKDELVKDTNDTIKSLSLHNGKVYKSRLDKMKKRTPVEDIATHTRINQATQAIDRLLEKFTQLKRGLPPDDRSSKKKSADQAAAADGLSQGKKKKTVARDSISMFTKVRSLYLEQHPDVAEAMIAAARNKALLRKEAEIRNRALQSVVKARPQAEAVARPQPNHIDSVFVADDDSEDSGGSEDFFLFPQ